MTTAPTQETVSLSANTSWYLYNFRRETIRMLRERGYAVVCLAPEDAYSGRLVSEVGASFVPLVMDHGGTNPIRDLGLLRQLWSAYRAWRPVLAMHFTIKNNVYGALAARALGIPAVNNVSGLGTTFIHGGWVQAVVRLLYRVSFPYATRVFCQNPDDYELLIRERITPRDRLRLIPGSGVDVERFRPRADRHRDGQAFRFLYLGRMLADKGIHELIAAYQGLRARGAACELWLAGAADAPNRSALSLTWLQALEREVVGLRYLGHVEDVHTLFGDVDCVVLPSYREGLSRTLLEGAAMALPLIATDVPGCRSIVKHGGNGLLCKPRDVQSLQGAMQRMLSMSAEEREALGRAGRSLVVDEFSVERVLQAYADVVAAVERDRAS